MHILDFEDSPSILINNNQVYLAHNITLKAYTKIQNYMNVGPVQGYVKDVGIIDYPLHHPTTPPFPAWMHLLPQAEILLGYDFSVAGEAKSDNSTDYITKYPDLERRLVFQFYRDQILTQKITDCHYIPTQNP